MTDDEAARQRAAAVVRRSYRTARLPPCVGIDGAAEILGVERSAIYRRLAAGTMIAPALLEGPRRRNKFWVREDVERLAAEIGEKRAAPVVQRSYRTSRLPPCVGLEGALEILQVEVSTVWRWLKPGTGLIGVDRTYLIPPALLEGPGRRTMFWVREDVERFAQEIGRIRAPVGQAKPRR